MDKEEKFKLKINIKSGNEEIDSYIDKLHTYILQDETNNVKRVIIAIDKITKEIADDLELIAKGDTWIAGETIYNDKGKVIKKTEGKSKLKVLSDDASTKTYERVLSLIKNIEDFQKINNIIKDMKPEIEEQVKKTKLEIDTTANPFEQIQKKVLESKKK